MREITNFQLLSLFRFYMGVLVAGIYFLGSNTAFYNSSLGAIFQLIFCLCVEIATFT